MATSAKSLPLPQLQHRGVSRGRVLSEVWTSVQERGWAQPQRPGSPPGYPADAGCRWDGHHSVGS